MKLRIYLERGSFNLSTFKHVAARFTRERSAALKDIGNTMQAEAWRAITDDPKTGRYYRRPITGTRYQASRGGAVGPFNDGETHADKTGALRRAVSFRVTGSKELRFGYGIGTARSPRYASFVEFGTKRMDQRPTLFNAIRASERNTEYYLCRAFDRAFR